MPDSFDFTENPISMGNGISMEAPDWTSYNSFSPEPGTWASVGQAGWAPSDYGDIARAFGFADEDTGPGLEGLLDKLASNNPYYTEGSKIYSQQGNPAALRGGFTPEYQQLLNSLTFKNTWDADGGSTTSATSSMYPGRTYSKYIAPPSNFDKLMSFAFPTLIGGALGGGLAGLFGGGITGGAAGYGLSSGLMSAGMGGDFAKGAISGAISGGLGGMAQGTPEIFGNNPSAYVPAQSGTSFSSLAGIENKTLGSMLNKGAGSALGTLATGGSGLDALKSGLTSAAISGGNSLGKQGMDYIADAFKTLMPQGDTEFENLLGSGGDMSNQTDVSPNRYDEMVTGSDGITTYNPEYTYSGDQVGNNYGNSFPTQLAPQMSPLSASIGSPQASRAFSPSSIGNYIGSHAGDLASMLYGFYNNRRQAGAVKNQMNTLQSMLTQAQNTTGEQEAAKLYGPNSPYAQQLRAQIGARAAAQGRRSNIGGREVQLQAMLADKNAQMQAEYNRNRTSLVSSLAPQLMQTNNSRMGLQNSNMNLLLQGMNKLGGWNAVGQGLQSLFAPTPSLTGAGSYDAYRNMDDMYGTVG